MRYLLTERLITSVDAMFMLVGDVKFGFSDLFPLLTALLCLGWLQARQKKAYAPTWTVIFYRFPGPFPNVDQCHDKYEGPSSVGRIPFDSLVARRGSSTFRDENCNMV